MGDTEHDDELKKHFCWESVDKVTDDPETTAFKRRARLQQSIWRERMKLAIGTQPMRPGPGESCRKLGSRIKLTGAETSLANFLYDDAKMAVRNRLAAPEPHQTLNRDRLHCDLLSSMPMCFNLFGHGSQNIEAADRAIKVCWPDAPGKLVAVRFEWSPGRSLRGEYLENRSAFDVAFELQLNDGRKGIIGIETKYHEHCKVEAEPGDERRKRYREVAEMSREFKKGATSEILGTDLQQIWQDHLLALSMLQHASGQWGWAKFVLIHPAKNPSYAGAAERYKTLLKAGTYSFESRTIESLLDTGLLPLSLEKVFTARYLW